MNHFYDYIREKLLNMNKSQKTNPWAWIPSLYFVQGIPYVAVMTISVIMYKRLGISNTDIALYTSWLYLPWVIKPFWSPFVDLFKTKRWWIVIMQLLVGAGFAGIAFSIPVPFFFQATLAFFWLLAFSSATHDIAADGFYMLALDSNSQAKFVGIRSTFYRCATILGQGVLIMFAGFLESATGLAPVQIDIEASPQYTQSSMFIEDRHNITTQEGKLHFVTNEETLRIGTFGVNKDSLQLFLDEITRLNQENGFIPKEDANATTAKQTNESWWTANISTPLGTWIKNTFGRPEDDSNVAMELAGNVGIATVWLSKSPDLEKEVVLNTNLSRGDKSIALILGDRLVFNELNWNKPAYLVFQLDRKLNTTGTAEYRGLSGNIAFAWSTTFFVLAGLLIFFSFYHKFALPKPESDKAANVSTNTILKNFLHTFVSFFKKKHIGTALFFILTYRFAEAQALKLLTPMLLDSPDAGGLGLTTGQVGLSYGTFGIIALTIGGIVGGIVASRGGLKKWLWPMAMSLLLPTLFYIYLAVSQPESFFIINVCIFLEQLGYGFGFTAFMLYLIYFSEGEHKTAHYAICTGFMALGMMIPGMFAGWLQELIGYDRFFIWVMICSIVPVIAVALLKIDPNFGKAKTN